MNIDFKMAERLKMGLLQDINCLLKWSRLLLYFFIYSFSNYVQPAILPSADVASKVDYYRKFAYATGWGKTKSGGDGSPILLEVKLRLDSNSECVNNNTRFLVDEDIMLCASKKGKDTCQVSILSIFKVYLKM